MSDYRDPLYRNDPLGQNTVYEPAGRKSGLGWIAGAVIVVIVIGVAVGLGHPKNGSSPATHTAQTATPPTAPGGAAHPMSMGLTPPPATAPAH